MVYCESAILRIFLSGDVEEDISEPTEELLEDKSIQRDDGGVLDEIVEFVLVILGHFIFIVEVEIGGITSSGTNDIR